MEKNVRRRKGHGQHPEQGNHREQGECWQAPDLRECVLYRSEKGCQTTACVREDASTHSIFVNLFNGRAHFGIVNRRAHLNTTELGPRNQLVKTKTLTKITPRVMNALEVTNVLAPMPLVSGPALRPVVSLFRPVSSAVPVSDRA